MQQAVIQAAVCPLWAEPSAKSTRVDEALYGMVVQVLDRSGDLYRVRTTYGYEGWIEENCLYLNHAGTAKWKTLPKKTVLRRHTCDVLCGPAFQSRPLHQLVLGGVVSPLDMPRNGWQEVLLCDGTQGFVRSSILGSYFDAPARLKPCALRSRIVSNAFLYWGSQYRWGGKSPLGIDCSGLVFMAYYLAGITVYRDAAIKDGYAIHPIARTQMQPADLLYFPGHVAMYLGNGQYIHATGATSSDGVTKNSLRPQDSNFRPDLSESLFAIGSYF